MLDLDREQPITLAEAPHVIPAINAVPGMETRKPLHPRTIYNWTTRGKRGVVLESVPVGGILVTTKEAIQRFFSRLSAARDQRYLEQERGIHPRRMVRRASKESRAVRAKLAAQHGI